jgi:aryl-alcohol dehydrogenase-like predicted oxidoreductase
MFSELGISLEASDIFEGGILAGQVGTERMIGRDPGGVRETIREQVEAFTRLAAEFDATPAQAAIAFCLGHPALATVLFGVSSRAQLTDNLAALELFRKHGDEIAARVDGIWSDRAPAS